MRFSQVQALSLWVHFPSLSLSLSLSLMFGFQSVKLDLKVWVGSDKGWVDEGGSVRTRTKDGLVWMGWSDRVRGQRMGWQSGLHTTAGSCVEGWF